MFQNLRINSTLYILHKDAVPYIEYGSVVNVSAPKPKYPSTPPLGQFPQMEMVVDVVVSINGQNTNLQGLPAGLDIADFGHNGNIVVSSSRDAINNEISMMKQKSNDILGSIDFHRNVITACDKMLTDLNPEVAEKQKQEQGETEAGTGDFYAERADAGDEPEHGGSYGNEQTADGTTWSQ